MNSDLARAARLLRPSIIADARRARPGGDGQQFEVVIALESEDVQTFMERVTAYSPPVRVAVYYPDTDKIVLAVLEPGDPEGESITVSSRTTVGMMLDATEQLKLPGRWDEVLRLTDITSPECADTSP